MTLGFSTARETFVNSFPSPEKFQFYTDMMVSIERLHLVQRQRTGDCSEIHVLR